jgi:hypothetical protein
MFCSKKIVYSSVEIELVRAYTHQEVGELTAESALHD